MMSLKKDKEIPHIFFNLNGLSYIIFGLNFYNRNIQKYPRKN